MLQALDLKPRAYRFGHGRRYRLDNGRWLVDFYHCGRYNIQTRRLTPAMFKAAFEQVRKLVPDDEIDTF